MIGHHGLGPTKFNKVQQRHNNCSIEQIVGRDLKHIQLRISEHNKNRKCMYACSILDSERSRCAYRTGIANIVNVQPGYLVRLKLPIYSIFLLSLFPHHPQPTRTSHKAHLSSSSVHFPLSHILQQIFKITSTSTANMCQKVDIETIHYVCNHAKTVPFSTYQCSQALLMGTPTCRIVALVKVSVDVHYKCVDCILAAHNL